MSDLDNAINSINESAAKAENTATFLDDMSTFDDQSSVTNPNNGQTVASIPKQVKDRTDELFTAAESDINQAVSDAAQSATDAQDAADSIGRYQGLWPDSGGIADKGDTYQTQVSGTPTGQYFTALQNTTVDPVGDDVNWREVVSIESLGGTTNYEAGSVANMIAGRTVGNTSGDSNITHKVGQIWETSLFNTACVAKWQIVSSGAGNMTDGTVQLDSGLYARLIVEDHHTIAHYGAYNNNSDNDFDAFNAMYQNTGRVKLIYRGDHKLVGTLTLPEGTNRREFDGNNATITLDTSMTDYLIIINGSADSQSYENYIRNCNVDLAGAYGFVNWNSGSFDSGLHHVYIYDSTETSSDIAVRWFNSFNMDFVKFRTSGSLGGVHLLLEEDNAISGFHNLTNCNLKDSTLQTNQDNSTLIKIDLPTTAADTISLDNVTLKANGSGSISLDIDGFINSLKLDLLHLESSDTVFRTAAGKTINCTMSDCTISDCRSTFNWGASGWINSFSNRWVKGDDAIPDKEIFTLMNAEFMQNGDFIADSSAFNTNKVSGSGTFRKDKKLVTERVGTTNVNWIDENRAFYNSSGVMTNILPSTDDVKAGFRYTAMQRGGFVTVQCAVGDRILGVSGTTSGGSIVSGSTGASVTLICQNIDGSDKFWQVESIVGTWIGS